MAGPHGCPDLTADEKPSGCQQHRQQESSTAPTVVRVRFLLHPRLRWHGQVTLRLAWADSRCVPGCDQHEVALSALWLFNPLPHPVGLPLMASKLRPRSLSVRPALTRATLLILARQDCPRLASIFPKADRADSV